MAGTTGPRRRGGKKAPINVPKDSKSFQSRPVLPRYNRAGSNLTSFSPKNSYDVKRKVKVKTKVRSDYGGLRLSSPTCAVSCKGTRRLLRGIQPDSTLALGDQETQEHATCRGAIFGRSPPAQATLL